MAEARYGYIPQAQWLYLGRALRGLDEDVTALEAGGGGGGGFVLLAYGEPLPDPPQAGVLYLRPTTPPTGGETFAPTVPGNVTASSITLSGFVVTWSPSTDVIGVTGYEYRVNGGTVTPYGFTSVAVTGLTPGTEYTFEVRARDGAGNRSAWSSPVTVTTTAGNASAFELTAPPGVLTGHIDGPVVLGTGFYTTLAGGMDVVGARYYVPAGLDSSFYNADVHFFTLVLSHVAGTALTGPQVAAAVQQYGVAQPHDVGWNECLFETPIHVNQLASGTNNAIWVCAKYSPPSTNYIVSAGNPVGATEFPAKAGVYRAEANFPASANSAVGSDGVAATMFYPVDALVAP